MRRHYRYRNDATDTYVSCLIACAIVWPNFFVSELCFGFIYSFFFKSFGFLSSRTFAYAIDSVWSNTFLFSAKALTLNSRLYFPPAINEKPSIYFCMNSNLAGTQWRRYVRHSLIIDEVVEHARSATGLYWQSSVRNKKKNRFFLFSLVCLNFAHWIRWAHVAIRIDTYNGSSSRCDSQFRLQLHCCCECRRNTNLNEYSGQSFTLCALHLVSSMSL